MQIFTSANDRYRRLLGALLASIIRNNQDALADIKVTILDVGLQPATRSALAKWTAREGLQLDFVEITSELYPQLLGKGAEPPQHYIYFGRVLAPYLVDSTLERFIYIDSDIINLRKIPALNTVDLKGGVVGAVLDHNIRTFSNPNNGERTFEGMPGDAPYFNSGMLIVDCQKWREQDISNQAIRAYNRIHETANFWDQYGLNVALHQKWTPFENHWNEIVKSGEDTIFRHFASQKPIAINQDKIPDEDRFFEFVDTSPWKKWRPNTRYSGLRRFAGQILYKIRS